MRGIALNAQNVVHPLLLKRAAVEHRFSGPNPFLRDKASSLRGGLIYNTGSETLSPSNIHLQQEG